MKPSAQKPNRLERSDRLELIMADQEALGMNDTEPDRQEEALGTSQTRRRQAREMLHYLTGTGISGHGNGQSSQARSRP